MYFYCSESVLFDIGHANDFYCEKCALIAFTKESFKLNVVKIHQLISVENSNYIADNIKCSECDKLLTICENITNLEDYCEECNDQKATIKHLLEQKEELLEKKKCQKLCKCPDCIIAHFFICPTLCGLQTSETLNLPN